MNEGRERNGLGEEKEGERKEGQEKERKIKKANALTRKNKD